MPSATSSSSSNPITVATCKIPASEIWQHEIEMTWSVFEILQTTLTSSFIYNRFIDKKWNHDFRLHTDLPLEMDSANCRIFKFKLVHKTIKTVKSMTPETNKIVYCPIVNIKISYGWSSRTLFSDQSKIFWLQLTRN